MSFRVKPITTGVRALESFRSLLGAKPPVSTRIPPVIFSLPAPRRDNSKSHDFIHLRGTAWFVPAIEMLNPPEPSFRLDTSRQRLIPSLNRRLPTDRSV